ncbi:hypothetical protein ACGE0T_01900 [Parabacteroides sp. APC149_11_2_Y6]
MKKKMIYLQWMTLLLFAFHISTASAQWKVGVQAGYTHNSLSTTSGYAYDRNYDALGGFTVGIPVQYEFVDWFALQADLSYTQKTMPPIVVVCIKTYKVIQKTDLCNCRFMHISHSETKS